MYRFKSDREHRMKFEEVQESDGLKVGDIVTAHMAGYHRITKIFKRTPEDVGPFHIAAYVLYKPLLNANGTKSSKKEYGCDIGFCKPALQSIDEQIKTLEVTRNKILDLQFDPK